ncbi:unnamed protein product [Moneuplotes crassus]|uniref:Uncharacterized protein n=3 Tax=Euplotes crassus TaxID=5936 RepID=A0AAD1U5B6_EUPCR|nr:unnamed protein product [Moneuplotes crassus]
MLNLRAKSFLKKPVLFTTAPKRKFAYIHNFHHPPAVYVNDKKHIFDWDISEYEPIVKAFLTRRWTTKREVAPKIEILTPLKGYRDSLYLQKLVPLERLLTEHHMVRAYESDSINTQYLMTIFCEEYEKNLYEAYHNKVLMNGQVPSLADYNEHEAIKKKADDLFDVFYNGDKLTSFERDIERRYLAAKFEKLSKYKKNKSERYKVRWTLSDINRFQEHDNYRMTDPEYLAKPKPIFSYFTMDDSLKHLYTYLDIKNVGRIRRFWVWLTEMRLYERSRHRNQLQAKIILQKLFQYPDTWEFVNQLEVEEDFHINHSIVNMHIWLVCTRLRDFTKNKFAEELALDLIDTFNGFTRNEIYDLDVMRKERKIESIENYLFAIRKNFDNHFYINGKTAENPYFKIDSLVWSCIYHEKVPRYSDKVYKMSEYLIKSFKYIKTLSYQDIEGGNFDWNACLTPINYEDRVIKYNIPLSEYEFQREMNSSYKVKKYHYNYRWPDELSEENLKKTFINMMANDHLYSGNEKSVKQEDLDFDALEGEAKKEMMFKLQQKLEEYGSLPTDDDNYYRDEKQGHSAISSQFEIWQKNMILPLSEQISEQHERKLKRDEIEKSQQGSSDSVFDEGVYDPNAFLDLEKYKKARKTALRNTYTTEQIEKKERQNRRIEELDKFAKGESADMKIIKRKKARSRFRPPAEEDIDDEVDDHVEIENQKKSKYRLW